MDNTPYMIAGYVVFTLLPLAYVLSLAARFKKISSHDK